MGFSDFLRDHQCSCPACSRYELPVIAFHAVFMINVMEPLGDQGELSLSKVGHPEKGRPDAERLTLKASKLCTSVSWRRNRRG
jgi:hypothetical protein